MAGFKIQCTTTGASESVTLPLVTGYTYDCMVDWGDGSPAVAVTAWDDADATHVYATADDYVAEITGRCDAWSVNNTHSSKLQWTEIVNWGESADFDGWAYLEYGFRGCSNLSGYADGPIISNGITSLDRLFNASGVTHTPSVDLLSLCVDLVSIRACWSSCSAMTGNLHKDTLANCVNLTTALGLFYSCSSMTATDLNGFFTRNPLITDYTQCFNGCNSLQLFPWMFFADGEQGSVWLDRNIVFANCFLTYAIPPTQGQAPDLWNCDFGTGTPVTTGCFSGSGNNATSIINYTNIPVAWGGSTVSDPVITGSTDDTIVLNQTGIVLSGTNFLFSGATLELCNNSDYSLSTVKQALTITSQTDLAITYSIPDNGGLWGLNYLFVTTERSQQNATARTANVGRSLFLFITNNDGTKNLTGHPITVFE